MGNGRDTAAAGKIIIGWHFFRFLGPLLYRCFRSTETALAYPELSRGAVGHIDVLLLRPRVRFEGEFEAAGGRDVVLDSQVGVSCKRKVEYYRSQESGRRLQQQ